MKQIHEDSGANMPIFARNSQYHKNQSFQIYDDNDFNNRTMNMEDGGFGINYNSEYNLSPEMTTGYGEKGSIFNQKKKVKKFHPPHQMSIDRVNIIPQREGRNNLNRANQSVDYTQVKLSQMLIDEPHQRKFYGN